MRIAGHDTHALKCARDAHSAVLLTELAVASEIFAKFLLFSFGIDSTSAADIIIELDIGDIGNVLSRIESNLLISMSIWPGNDFHFALAVAEESEERRRAPRAGVAATGRWNVIERYRVGKRGADEDVRYALGHTMFQCWWVKGGVA